MKDGLRTMLFVPGDRPSRITGALGMVVDAVVIDLEDAVAPSAKASARQGAVEAIRGAQEGVALLTVRVNPVESAFFDDDLAALDSVLRHIRVILLPKAESESDVTRLSEALEASEKAQGLPLGQIAILPIVETARGVLNAREVVESSSRVSTLMFGAADLSAELGVTVTPDGLELLHARSQVVLAIAAAGKSQPIDGPHLTLRDAPGLERSARAARLLGFAGKAVIHPEQLSVVAGVFRPTDAEVEWAELVENAHREAQSAGSGVATLADGTFIDEPVVTQARRILAAHARSVA